MVTVITIDGPAGTGKSTVARQLAERLGFAFLDTGAMYRSVAWRALRDHVELTDPEAIARAAETIDFRMDGDRFFVDGTEVTELIRRPEVTRASSYVAAVPAIRQKLVELQRQAARQGRLVTEGRDQGTIVFPDAACKFFLTATPRARAERRHVELQQRGQATTLEKLLKELEERDHRDQTRQHAPLKPADDAVVIDTTDMTLSDVLAALESKARQKIPSVTAP